MEALTDLTKGLEILNPFLVQYGFKFDKFDHDTAAQGQFVRAIYSNTKKRFMVTYSISVEQVVYQYDHSTVSHYFYLDKLGHADKKQFPDFQLDDSQLSFKNILLDFHHLADDFFIGSCTKLTEFCKLRDELIHAQEPFEYKFDTLKIDYA